MSWTHIEDTKPKARKRYWCELCERWIEKGEIHVKRFGIGDDGRLSARMHITCEKLTRGWGIDEWENQDPSEFRRELEEVSNDMVTFRTKEIK